MFPVRPDICDALFTTLDFCIYNGIITAKDLGEDYGTDRFKNDLKGYIGLSKSCKIKAMTNVQKILDILDSVYSVAYGEKIDWEKHIPSFERYSRDPYGEGVYTEKTVFELVIPQDNIKKALEDYLPKGDSKQSIKDVHELAMFLQKNPTARLMLRAADDLNRKGWRIAQSQLKPTSRTAERKNESFRVFPAIKLTILALLCTDRGKKEITIDEETIERCMCIHIESCKTNPCDIIDTLDKDVIILTPRQFPCDKWKESDRNGTEDFEKRYDNNKHKIIVYECNVNDFREGFVKNIDLCNARRSTKNRPKKDIYTYGFDDGVHNTIIRETGIDDIRRLESVNRGYGISRVRNRYETDDYLIDGTLNYKIEEMMPIARDLLERYLKKMNEAYLDGNLILYRSFFEQLLSTKYENTGGRMMLTGGERNEWGFWVDDSLTITLFRIYAQEKCRILTPYALILANEWNIHLPRGSIFVMNNHIALVAKFTPNGNELTEIKEFVDTVRVQETSFNIDEEIKMILAMNNECYDRMAKTLSESYPKLSNAELKKTLYNYSKLKDIAFIDEESLIEDFKGYLESSSEKQIR